MDINYKTLKIFEQKDTRIVSLIEYEDKVAILKQLTTKNRNLKGKFDNEINILISIKKKYVPMIYDHGENFFVMEYIEAYKNDPDSFSKFVNEKIINRICEQLIDIKTSKISNYKTKKKKILLNVFKAFLKEWKNKSFKIYHLKASIVITFLYLKNRKYFNCDVNTKGDFTELNMLYTKTNQLMFIDFDNFTENGFWLEDASYLLLHQDAKLKDLKWQKIFFKKYLENINTKIKLSEGYIRFWLLHTSIIHHNIRFFQNKEKKTKLSQNQLNIKEERIKFFLKKKNFKSFLKDIKNND